MKHAPNYDQLQAALANERRDNAEMRAALRDIARHLNASRLDTHISGCGDWWQEEPLATKAMRDEINQLAATVDELRRQRDDARKIARDLLAEVQRHRRTIGRSFLAHPE